MREMTFFFSGFPIALDRYQSSLRMESLASDPEFVKNYGDAQIETKEIVALIAYLQRLGTDIKVETTE